MSPEQLRAEPLDERSDLFSFGLVLYEVATGRPAIEGNTYAVAIDSILNRKPPPARDLRPDLPEHLAAILDRLLEKIPDDRFQTAADVRDSLMSPGQTVPPSAPRSPAADDDEPSPGLTLGRKRSPWWVPFTLVGLGTVGGWFGALAGRGGWDWRWNPRLLLTGLVCTLIGAVLWWWSGWNLSRSQPRRPTRVRRLAAARSNRIWIGGFVVALAFAILMTGVTAHDAWLLFQGAEDGPDRRDLVVGGLEAALFWFMVVRARRWRDHPPSRRSREIEVEGSYAQILDGISRVLRRLEARVTSLDLEAGAIEASTSAGFRSWGERLSFDVQRNSPARHVVKIQSQSIVPFTLFDAGKNESNVQTAVELLG
jgi:hypothetical protein